jgi:hypothetical protein
MYISNSISFLYYADIDSIKRIINNNNLRLRCNIDKDHDHVIKSTKKLSII